MNQEEITRLCSRLSLSEVSGPKVTIDGRMKLRGDSHMNLSLAGKVFCPKLVNRDAFRTVMPRIWRVTNPVETEVVGENVFLFIFGSQQDRQRVLNGGPWLFDNCLVLLEELGVVGDLRSLCFKFVDFWVQLHNVPVLCMTPEICKMLGSQIGSVVGVDCSETGRCVGKYVRVRIRVDVSKPLMRCLKVCIDGIDGDLIIIIRYEKLPEFCHACGKIGHSHWECIEVVGSNRGRGGDEMDYGPWMRASNGGTMGNMRKVRRHSQAEGVEVTTSEGSDQNALHGKAKFTETVMQKETTVNAHPLDAGNNGKSTDSVFKRVNMERFEEEIAEIGMGDRLTGENLGNSNEGGKGGSNTNVGVVEAADLCSSMGDGGLTKDDKGKGVVNGDDLEDTLAEFLRGTGDTLDDGLAGVKSFSKKKKKWTRVARVVNGSSQKKVLEGKRNFAELATDKTTVVVSKKFKSDGMEVDANESAGRASPACREQ